MGRTEKGLGNDVRTPSNKLRETVGIITKKLELSDGNSLLINSFSILNKLLFK